MRPESLDHVSRVEANSSRASPPTPIASTPARVPFVGRSSAWSGSQARRSATPCAAPREGDAVGSPSRSRHGATAHGIADPPTRRRSRGDRAVAPCRAPARQFPHRAVLASIEPRPPDRRVGRSRRALARDEGAARAHRPRTQPTLGEARLGVLGSIPRATLENSPGSSRGARLRIAERSPSRVADPRHRCLFFGALVRRLEPKARRSPALPGRDGENLAAAGRVETSRVDQVRGGSTRSVALKHERIDSRPGRSLRGREPRARPAATRAPSARSATTARPRV